MALISPVCIFNDNNPTYSYPDLLNVTREWLALGELKSDEKKSLEQKTKELEERTVKIAKQCLEIAHSRNFSWLDQFSNKFFDKFTSCEALEKSVSAMVWNARSIQENGEIRVPAFFQILQVIAAKEEFSKIFPLDKAPQDLEFAKLEIFFCDTLSNIVELQERKKLLQGRVKSYVDALKPPLKQTIETASSLRPREVYFGMVYELLKEWLNADENNYMAICELTKRTNEIVRLLENKKFSGCASQSIQLICSRCFKDLRDFNKLTRLSGVLSENSSIIGTEVKGAFESFIHLVQLINTHKGGSGIFRFPSTSCLKLQSFFWKIIVGIQEFKKGTPLEWDVARIICENLDNKNLLVSHDVSKGLREFSQWEQIKRINTSFLQSFKIFKIRDLLSRFSENQLKNIHSLHIRDFKINSNELKSLVSRATNLKRLYLKNCIFHCDFINEIKDLPLKELKIENCSLTDISQLKEMELDSLTLFDCHGINDYSVLKTCNLDSLYLKIPDSFKGFWFLIDWFTNPPDPKRSSLLKTFKFSGYGELNLQDFAKMHPEIQGLDFESQLLDDPGKWLVDLQFVEHLPKLEELNISNCANITDLKPLKFVKLKKLNLNDCEGIKNFHQLKKQVHLKTLNLSHTFIKEIDFLSECKDLEKLCLDGCKIKNLTPLSLCSKLTDLSLMWTDVKNLSFLEGLPLKSVKLKKCSKLQDVSALIGMPSLLSANLRQCKNVPKAQIETLRANGVRVIFDNP